MLSSILLCSLTPNQAFIAGILVGWFAIAVVKYILGAYDGFFDDDWD
jgi:hypothetical protein